MRFEDSGQATTTFTVIQLRGSRRVAVASFVHHDRAGLNGFRFGGSVASRALAPGRYLLQALPHLAGHAGSSVTAAFQIVA